jgi:outer membrane immunogenic protein
MYRAFFGMAAAAALIGAPALAADMPLKAPAAPTSTWSGGYVGLELGELWGSDVNWTTTCLTTVTNCASGAGPSGANPFFVDASSPRTIDPASLWGGLYFGYDRQIANFVVGLEADVAYADNNKTTAGIVGCTTNCGFVFGTAGNIDSTSVRLQGDGSLRGRLGFLAWPDLLVYGTGGFAVQQVSTNVTCSAAGPWCIATRSQTNSALLPGYTIGGGLEWRYTGNWFLRAEYRYSAFQNSNTSFFTGTPDEVDASVRVHTSIANVGIAYKLYDTPQ